MIASVRKLSSGAVSMTASQEPQVLFVLAASYDSVEAAREDFEAVRALYDEIKASDLFDAAVLAKDDKGKVHIEKTYEAGTRHDALKGLGWGLAAGAAAALFPAVGIAAALAAGGAGGAAIGALAGHHQKGMDRGELKQVVENVKEFKGFLLVLLGERLDEFHGRSLRCWQP